jgi:hypothetical protein
MICYTRDVGHLFGICTEPVTRTTYKLPVRAGMEEMKRILAVIQLIIIVLIVGFGTWQLYLGNFEMAFVSFPFLIVYYLFVIARQRRQ